MFYDLETPMEFMREVVGMLEENGIWVLEQSYLPTMLERNSYDTVCHEHLEYYALSQIKWMTDRCDAKIVDVSFNDVNGGSFSVAVARVSAPQSEFEGLQALLVHERSQGLNGLAPFTTLQTAWRRAARLSMPSSKRARSEGARVAALGASTKGNILLQYCDVTTDDIEAVGRGESGQVRCIHARNLLPIVAEDELLASNPDYLIVLTWHFRPFFEESASFGWA